MTRFRPLSLILENKPGRYCLAAKNVCLFSKNSRLVITSPPHPCYPALPQLSVRPGKDEEGNQGLQMPQPPHHRSSGLLCPSGSASSASPPPGSSRSCRRALPPHPALPWALRVIRETWGEGGRKSGPPLADAIAHAWPYSTPIAAYPHLPAPQAATKPCPKLPRSLAEEVGQGDTDSAGGQPWV